MATALSTEMDEEPSLCNLSLAVDCTLSLGSSLSRAPEAPATRLSRAGSPDPDLALSLSVRSEGVDAARRRTVEHDRSEQDMSWGSSCIRSDSDATPEYYPPVHTHLLALPSDHLFSCKRFLRSAYLTCGCFWRSCGVQSSSLAEAIHSLLVSDHVVKIIR